ncbi:prolyl 4-hydroxylase subunit alpha-1-like isoform X2 [Hippocampus zosterae]|uniref:prolyl 4-hydroxylase subunit alpha-1-like isoform X2 n=1 Tax=Hippocampus zosterae TaxID=109293 RepID=UPI00223DE88E|nr:prolyl 4-hydroxylase subunit alpha-1-like isoform X2 [Hippocampus zosterae]
MAVFCLLVILISFSLAADEFYSSIGRMTELLYTEQQLLAALDDYIQAEESKLETVKRWSERLANMSAFAIKNPERFLSHPVNAFKLLKRMNREWRALEMLVRSNVSHGFVSYLDSRSEHLPDGNDLTGVAEALVRLQDTYQLDTGTMAKGELPGSSLLLSKLTVDDCYDVAMAAYGDDDFYHTELWMAQALLQLEQGETPENVGPVTLLDYHSYALYKQGDLEAALVSTKKLLEIDPENERGKQNLKYFEEHLAKQQTTETLKKGRVPKHSAYERLCRGNSVEMTPLKRSLLSCRYHDNHRHPNLLIAPVKEEELWDQPRIVRYYDIVSEEDMAIYKALAQPQLMRSKVRDGKTEKSYPVRTRVSQNAWLKDKAHERVGWMVRRIGDITGLDVSTAEDLQVANYGVGGQYEPHVDFQRLSDVQAGGATVFPNVGAIAWPIKGSAVFWYNLLHDGQGNYETQHAACPVLVGSKWVANKWLHERGQEFRRRCGLQSST